jgi:hypothetical protein
VAVGEKLRVVGNSEALGDWDPLKGIELEWTEGHMWRASVALPADTKTSFKFIKVDESGTVLEWEDGEDRSVSLMDYEAPVLDLHTAWAEYGAYSGLDNTPVCTPLAMHHSCSCYRLGYTVL